MVPARTILDAAEEHDVDVIGLSGLITPSLDEMCIVAREMKRREMDVPLLIGGATTSQVHTAVKIAPSSPYPVVYVTDASRAVGVANSLMSDHLREDGLTSRNSLPLPLGKRLSHKRQGMGYWVQFLQPYAPVRWSHRRLIEAHPSPDVSSHAQQCTSHPAKA